MFPVSRILEMRLFTDPKEGDYYKSVSDFSSRPESFAQKSRLFDHTLIRTQSKYGLVTRPNSWKLTENFFLSECNAFQFSRGHPHDRRQHTKFLHTHGAHWLFMLYTLSFYTSRIISFENF
jgi:hypothetical protein